MSIEKNAIDALIKTVSSYVDKALKDAKFDITTQGKVVEILDNGKYKVQIQGTVYTAPCFLDNVFKIDDIVKIMIPQNNWSNMFILSQVSKSVEESTSVISVNGKTGNVVLNINDIPNLTTAINNLQQQINESSKTYVHNQVIPSNEWIINHGLNCFPQITIIDSAGNVVLCDIIYLEDNLNRVIAKPEGSFSGKAICNK